MSAVSITGITVASQTFTVNVSYDTIALGGTPTSAYLIVTDAGTAGSMNLLAISPATATQRVVQSSDIAGGIVNGTTYLVAYQVQVVTPTGTQTYTTSAQTVVPAGIPDAPTLVSALSLDAEIELTYQLNGDNGAQYDELQLMIMGSDYSYGTRIIDVSLNADAPTTYTYTLIGTDPLGTQDISNGVTYEIFARVSNSIGWSATSNTVSATPSNVPGAPQSVGISTDCNRVINYQFSAPADAGAAPPFAVITGYHVEFRPDPSYNTVDLEFDLTGAAYEWPNVGPFSLSLDIVQKALLTPGATYKVYVKANSAEGYGPYGSSITAETYKYAPEQAHSIVTQDDIYNNNYISGTTSWTNNGIDISYIVLNMTDPSSNSIYTNTYPVVSSDLSFNWDISLSDISGGLTAGVTYILGTLTTNVAGCTSIDGNPQGFTPYTIPSAPASLVLTYQDQGFQFTYGAAPDNGSTITNYIIQVIGPDSFFYDNINLIALGLLPGSPHSYSSLPGAPPLINGETYTVYIQALNAAGWGPSVSSTVVPAVPPSPPASLSKLFTDYAVTNADVTFYWSLPSDSSGALPGTTGGLPIITYEVSLDDATFSSPIAVDPSVYTFTVGDTDYFSYAWNDLSYNTTYTFYVRTVTSVGNSAATSTTATPAQVPLLTGLTYTPPISPATTGTITVTVNDRGSPLTNYICLTAPTVPPSSPPLPIVQDFMSTTSYVYQNSAYVLTIPSPLPDAQMTGEIMFVVANGAGAGFAQLGFEA